MPEINIKQCEGCCRDFANDDLSEDGYCEHCEYEHDAKQDNQSSEQFNHE